MELGPIQKAWVESLRKHPERQCNDVLGHGSAKSYKACCLGELIITECRVKKKKIPFDTDGNLYDINIDTLYYLGESYSRLGLRSSEGHLIGRPKIAGSTYPNLASANDDEVSWITIADFIEQNPEKVFTKSA